MMTKLDGQAIRRAVAEVYTTEILQGVLDRARSGEEIYRFMSRFVQYSSPSGWSQAVLAGSMALRSDIFRDPSEHPAFGDRSVDVASGVFHGAIDEFGDREVGGIPHRRMALALVKEMAAHFEVPPDQAGRIMRGHAPTNEAVAGVLEGYGVGRSLEDREIFHGFGFHLGTEIVADDSFNVIDRHLRTHFPDLVARLSATAVRIGDHEIDAYTYVSRHTTAEGDHFEAALAVVDRAVDHYCGQRLSRSEVVACVLAGAVRLADLERRFMRSVLEPPRRSSVAPGPLAAVP
jgi:hypothetical protein